jgi:hypothetical protein
MTHNKDIIGIFRQNRSFWHSLVVWVVIMLHLVVYGATLKTTGRFGGLFCSLPIF